MTPWEIEGEELVVCNCDYGCPCQFNALPTHGNCEAMASFDIKRGFFGDTRLDGLRAVCIMAWPGPIHEGAGKAFMIIDERADEAQREALITILSGGETDVGATVWAVFAATLEEVFEPAFRSIELSVDIESRVGRVSVPGLANSTGEPIRNPVTGEEHRARIDLTNGFEYTVAEMGSANFETSGPIVLSHEDSYAQFAHIHLNNHGLVRGAAA